MVKKVLSLIFIGLILNCLICGSAFCKWYRGRVIQAVPYSEGEVYLQVYSTTQGKKVKVYIDTTTDGGTNLYAAVLTAIALETNITFSCSSVPSWTTIHETTAIGLAAP